MKELIFTHSLLRWIVLILLVYAVFLALYKWIGKKNNTALDKMIYQLSAISFHTQILLGLILYFISNKVQFGENTMSVAVIRFFTVEHIAMMLIAFVLILVGRRKAEKSISDLQKNKRYFLWYGIALLIIIASIPWPFRPGLVDGWI
jgi:hypothetical protein